MHRIHRQDTAPLGPELQLALRLEPYSQRQPVLQRQQAGKHQLQAEMQGLPAGRRQVW